MPSHKLSNATSCTDLLQKLSIGGSANDNVPAAVTGAARYNKEKSANLLSLPNELLYQIVSYLVPTDESIPQAYGFSALPSGVYMPECVASLEDSDESDDDDDSEIPDDSITGPIARNAHADAIGLLLDLALVGKKLAPVVQEVLYVHVSLPQPQDAPSPNTRYTSSISRFLQTIINRPDLAARVKQVSVWTYKGKAFDHFAPAHPDHPMGTSDPAFRVMLDQAMKNLSLKDADFEAWRRNLPRPTEAMICGLVFAALARLQTVAIYAKRFPTPIHNENEEHKLRNLYARSDEAEIACLSHGLAVTKIHSLALSANLNGLHRAGLPSLTTLQLNYSEPNPFVTVGKGSFINVTVLKICVPLRKSLSVISQAQNHRKLKVLFSGLKNIRVLEFDNEDTLDYCPIPPCVQTVIIRPAIYTTLSWLQDYSQDHNVKTSLSRIELYWRDFEQLRRLWMICVGSAWKRDASIKVENYLNDKIRRGLDD